MPGRLVIGDPLERATSGLGREMGPESVAAYQQLKSIYLMG